MRLLPSRPDVSEVSAESRRALLLTTLSGAVLALAGCAASVTTPVAPATTVAPQVAPAGASHYPPIVFVHGNGDGAAQWQTTVWRFESNGWPRDRLFALRHPHPWARDNDAVEQSGRTSTTEHMEFLRAEVDRVLAATGERQVVLIGNSRGGNAIRNFITNGGGADKVSHALLAGTPNHGTSAIAGFRDGSEFSGLSPFLRQLNAPKNAAGDEVVGPVQWMTLRSDNNDLFAQPDGRFMGKAGQPTNVGYDGPALRGAINVVLSGADHRETAYSAAAFAQMHPFIRGTKAPTLDIVPEAAVTVQGRATGLGVDPLDASSGNLPSNLPLPGALVEVFEVDAATGERLGTAKWSQTVAADGGWGPAAVRPNQPVELVVSAPGYATTHYYRSGFPRSSSIVDLRGTRVPVADAFAPSVVYLWRPRGYLDPSRRMALDGAVPKGVPAGSALSINRIKPDGPVRAIVGEFEGERIVGRNWPLKEGHVVYLEITR